MSGRIPLSDEQRENLVAWLDGELDEVSARDMEQTLADDPDLRQEVVELTQSWDLLAALPQVTASSEFTERTLDSVRTAALDGSTSPQKTPPIDGAKKKTWSAERFLFGLAVFGLLLALLVGYRSGEQWQPDRTRILINNLPVIQDYDLYRELGDQEFLRQLREEKVLADGQDSKQQ